MGLMMVANRTDLESTIGYATSAGAVLIALDRIQSEQLLIGADISFSIQFDQCDESLASGIAAQMLLEDDVDIIIGPTCSVGAIVTGVMGKYTNLPVIGWAATFADLSDVVRFPTMSRTVGSTLDIGRALCELMTYFGWTEFAMIYTDDGSRRKCYYIQQGLDTVLQEPGYTIVVDYIVTIPGTPSQAQINSFLDTVKTRARIIISCLDRDSDTRALMIAASQKGMVTDEYIYIIPDVTSEGFGSDSASVSQGYGFTPMWVDQNKPSDGLDAVAHQAFQNAFVVDFDQLDPTTIDDFKKQVVQRIKEYPFFCTTGCSGANQQYGSAYSPNLHDAVYLYALALNKTLQQDPGAKRNGTLITENCITQFSGKSGEVIIDGTGSRLPVVAYSALDVNGNVVVYAKFYANEVDGKVMSSLYS